MARSIRNAQATVKMELGPSSSSRSCPFHHLHCALTLSLSPAPAQAKHRSKTPTPIPKPVQGNWDGIPPALACFRCGGLQQRQRQNPRARGRQALSLTHHKPLAKCHVLCSDKHWLIFP